MRISGELAKQIRSVFFGGNWTCSHLKEHLEGLNFSEAILQIDEFSSIATLTYHLAYFVNVQIEVLESGILNGDDKLSFQTPNFSSQKDWDDFLTTIWLEADRYVQLVEELPDDKLFEKFIDEKYGNYLRNILGNIEHIHYHLGQIVLLKKLISSKSC